MPGIKIKRLPKKEYLLKIANRKSENFCHKKKLGFNYAAHDNLYHSKDKEGNILCGICRILLVPKNISYKDDEFKKYINKIVSAGGEYNCCYDCNFRWFCNKCSLNYNGFRSCSNTFMLRLQNNNYRRGRYILSENEHECLKEYFKNNVKYNSIIKGHYIDIFFMEKLYEKDNYQKHFEFYRKAVKNVSKTIKKTDTTLNLEDMYMDYYVFDKVIEEYENLLFDDEINKKLYLNKNNELDESFENYLT